MIVAAAAVIATLLAPAHGHAFVTGSDLTRAVMLSSATAVGCASAGSGCPKYVNVSFPDRPGVIYPAAVRTSTKLGQRLGIAVLTVERGQIAPFHVSGKIAQGDALTLPAPCRLTPSPTYVAGVGEDGAWIRIGVRAAAEQAGCPIIDAAGNVAAIVDGSDDPLSQDPAVLAIAAELAANSDLRIDERWMTAPLDVALSTARSRSGIDAMPWWCRAADLGNLEATVACARGYAVGAGAPLDVAYALTLFARAAQHGSAEATTAIGQYDGDREDLRRRANALSTGDRSNAMVQLDIGEAYATGVGAARDEAQAVAWFDRCASRVSLCAYDLGTAYLGADGVIRDEKRGVELLEWAGSHCDAATGSTQPYDFYRRKCTAAFVTLGNHYFNSASPAYNIATARGYYEKAATVSSFARDQIEKIRLNGSALPDVAASQKPMRGRIADVNSYYSTHIGPQFHATVASMFKTLAASKDPAALYAAGAFYAGTAIDHTGDVDDDENAVHYYVLAADAGSYEGAYAAAVAYWNGKGVAANHPESQRFGRLSVALAKKAAAANDSGAFAFLGSSYMNGYYDSVTVDCHEAIKWYLLAANANDRAAYYTLGVLYTGQLYYDRTYSEEPSCRDPRAGEHWLRAAIDTGDVLSMEVLASLLRSGGLGRVDPAEANRLLQAAVKAGDPDAQRLLQLK